MFEGLVDTDFLDTQNFWMLTGVLFIVVFVRYLMFSGIFVLFRRWFTRRVINDGLNHQHQILLELCWSTITSFIFAISGTIMVILWQKGYTMLYIEVDAYPYWYLPVSLLVSLLIHESYYYWLHRWMHRPKVFQILHKVHHDSIKTSALTSFSFHPLESILQAIIVPVIIFLIPINIYVLLLQLVIMTISGTLNHAGVELYPNGFHKHWLGKWLIGATHHDLHHKQFNKNFGLYFTFWDRWMKTESKDYKIDIRP